jgi:hypothetical protein
MSLKIERDTVKETVNKGGLVGSAAVAVAEAATGNLPGTSGKHPVAAVVGTALTGGRQNAGTKGYLAVRLSRAHLRRFGQPATDIFVCFFSRPTSDN